MNTEYIKQPAKPVVIPLNNVIAEQVTWLWDRRIPLGALTLVVGNPGVGKSFLAMDIAARVSAGIAFPDGAPCEAGGVVLVSDEDSLHATIQPRLKAQGADMTNVVALEGNEVVTTDGTTLVVPFTLKDMEILEAAMQAVLNCRLVIIDPIGSFFGARYDPHRDNEVRALLRPLALLAKRYRVAIVLIAHSAERSAARASTAGKTVAY